MSPLGNENVILSPYIWKKQNEYLRNLFKALMGRYFEGTKYFIVVKILCSLGNKSIDVGNVEDGSVCMSLI